MLIEVTQEDIAEGSRRNPADCPIARAMSRKLGKGVSVNGHTFRVGRRYGWLPPSARKFIWDYDSVMRYRVRPFSFTVSLANMEA